jgi:N-acetylglutamate synthase-like GNAT family acetyltransferase
MKFEFIDEFKINEKTKNQISELLKICFSDEDYGGRTYFKQIPQYRILVKENGNLIGQLGLDYRIMTINKKPIRVLGVIDLLVSPEKQKLGIGTKMLDKLNRIAEQNRINVDFILLVADKHKFYEKSGFKLTKQNVKWFATENHINYGIQEGKFDNCLMIKQIGRTKWEDDTELDMLGYWY